MIGIVYIQAKQRLILFAGVVKQYDDWMMQLKKLYYKQHPIQVHAARKIYVGNIPPLITGRVLFLVLLLYFWMPNSRNEYHVIIIYDG